MHAEMRAQCLQKEPPGLAWVQPGKKDVGRRLCRQSWFKMASNAVNAGRGHAGKGDCRVKPEVLTCVLSLNLVIHTEVDTVQTSPLFLSSEAVFETK